MIRKQFEREIKTAKKGSSPKLDVLPAPPVQWSFFCTLEIPKCNTAHWLPKHSLPLNCPLFKYELPQASMSLEARQICLTPKFTSPPLFLRGDIKNYWEIGMELKIQIKLLVQKNQIQIVIAMDYTTGNMQMYAVSCKNVHSNYATRLWFFFQMPGFNSTTVQHSTECSTGQKDT